MVVYASTPIRPDYVVAPSPANQQMGTKPLDTLPSQWWNWFLQEATKRFNGDANLIGNMVSEIENLLALCNITPDPDSVTQLRDMFDNQYRDLIMSDVEPKLDEIKDNINDTIVPQIDAINEKIPAQASAENQLADKNFVNSTVATNTANYIGNFDSVDALNAYSGTLTNNDYAYVVITDSVGNVVYNRYKYNGDEGAWKFEYKLNNTGFTAEQMAAINSGVTATAVAQIATNKNNVATLTAKTKSLSADGTTYSGKATTAGTADTAKACTGNAATATKLATARTINDVAFNGSANIKIGCAWADITGKPTIPTANNTAIYYNGTKYNSMKVTSANGLLNFTFE